MIDWTLLPGVVLIGVVAGLIILAKELLTRGKK